MNKIRRSKNISVNSINQFYNIENNSLLNLPTLTSSHIQKKSIVSSFYNYNTETKLKTEVFKNYLNFKKEISFLKNNEMKKMISPHFDSLHEKAQSFYVTQNLKTTIESNENILSSRNETKSKELKGNYEYKNFKESKKPLSKVKFIINEHIKNENYKDNNKYNENIIKNQFYASYLKYNQGLVIKENISDFIKKTKIIRLRNYFLLHKNERKKRIIEVEENENEKAVDTFLNLSLSKICFYDNFINSFNKYLKKIKLQKEIEYKHLFKLKQEKQKLDSSLRLIEIKLIKQKELIKKYLEYKNFLLSVKLRDLSFIKNDNLKEIPIMNFEKIKSFSQLEDKKEIIFNESNDLINCLIEIEDENLFLLEKFNRNRILIKSLQNNINFKTKEQKILLNRTEIYFNQLFSQLNNIKKKNERLKEEKEFLLKNSIKVNLFSKIFDIIYKMTEKINNYLPIKEKKNENLIFSISSLERGINFFIEYSTRLNKLDPEKFKRILKFLDINNRLEKTKKMKIENLNRTKLLINQTIIKFNKNPILPLRKTSFRYKPKSNRNLKRINKSMIQLNIHDFLDNE